MIITGDALIGGQAVKGTGAALRAYNPTLQQVMDPEFFTVDFDQIDQACRAADAAFDTFRALSDERRAVFLETIAEQIMALGDVLIERTMAETGLPRARIEVSAAAPSASSNCLPTCCARARGTTCASTRRCRIGRRRVPTCACA